MSFFMAPWDQSLEPSQGNVRQWLDNLWSKFQPLEQSRWNQSNIDSLFYAGSQSYINNYFGFTPGNSAQKFYFNFIQQPINLVTGYQRQHRKNILYVPSEGADPNTTDQYTRIIDHQVNVEGIAEAYSKACELACVTGLVLMQPYLDYKKDPAQGDLRVKVWEYNSFLIDPYAREPDFSDAQFVWCQEYISKQEAEERFPEKKNMMFPMSGLPQTYGSFYFLPEQHNMARNDLMVLSYVWYKWKKKKKRLYSPSRHQFFDFGGGQQQLETILYNIPDLQVVEVDVPTWKLAVILNDQLMFQGENPLGFEQIPVVPVYWNYEPHLNQYDLRCRGLVRTLRDSQFLLNRQIIISHDQKESVINSGWMRKVGAVANEDNLKKGSQGYDVIVNEGYEIGVDVQKIQPNVVPESDFALADRLISFIGKLSGIDMENWSAQEDPNASSLTVMLKQAANLTVLQKYFDQWDYSFKTLGELLLQIVLNNWNAAKVGLILGEEPSPHFYSKIFAKYQCIVEEGINTPTQKSMAAKQKLEINQIFGREVFPPSMIIEEMNMSGKAKAIEYLQQQEMQAQAMQQEQQQVAHAFEHAKLQELISKAASNLATARERHSRSDSNLGLFEERLSMISKNRAAATKDKVESLQKLIEAIHKYGEVETMLKESELQSFDYEQIQREDVEKDDAKRTSAGNEFVAKMLASLNTGAANQEAMR